MINTNDYLARPRQSLDTHVIGMVDAFKKIRPRINANYHVPLLEMITLHDAGKINPCFQQKLVPGASLTDAQERLSYHVELSVIWLFLYYHLETPDKPLTPARSASLFAIMSHHLGGMKDASDLHLDLEKSKYLLQQLKQLKNSDIHAVLNLIKKVQAHVRETFELSIFPKLDHVEDCITQYIQAMCKAKPVIILKFWGKIVNNLVQKAIDRKIENPCLLPLLFSSILFDLDVWDARFYTPEHKIHAFPFEIDPVRVKPEMVSLFCEKNFGTPDVDPSDQSITQVRKVFRKAVGSLDSGDLDNLAGKILRLNAPTGSGKTINMLDVAIRLRHQIDKTKGYYPRIIYCLPFVALGEQVASVAREVLQIGSHKFQSPAMIVHNYLAPVKFKQDEGENEGFINPADASWHVHTWQASIIITTFVQLLNTIFNAEKRYWTRAHVLAGSIILLDEVQTIPARYWDLISTSFSSLSTLTGATIIFSTATQPAIFPPGEDLAIDLPTGLADEYELDRYDIQWHPCIRDIDGLVELTCNHIRDFPRDDIMIVVNTTRVAKEIWQKLRLKATSGDIDVDTELIYLLSGLVIPKHRKELLEDDICTMLENKEREKGILLVCTQLIEAGVDVSFHTVYRDLAPLDSIVQVAGRCNRSGDISKGKLHVVNLMFDDNKTYADLVYNQDLVDLEKTKHFLDRHAHSTPLPEKELRRIFPEYYSSIREARETSTGVRSMASCAYRTLKEEFHLIDTLSNMATLFIPIDKRSKQIRDKLLKMSDDKFKPFPRGFYLYSINLNLKYLEEDAIAPLLPKEARNTFLLKKLSLYDKDGGLDIML